MGIIQDIQDTGRFGFVRMMYGDMDSLDATIEDFHFPELSEFTKIIDPAGGMPVFCFDRFMKPYGYEARITQGRNYKWVGKGAIKTEAGVVRSNVTTCEHETLEDAYADLQQATIGKVERLLAK